LLRDIGRVGKIMLKKWILRNNGEGCKPYPVAEDMDKSGPV
jgi:hypothetical protein